MKLYIRSSAMRRSDIGDFLEGQTLPLLEALAQLYLFPNCEYVNHWRQEVWSTLYQVKRIKGKHKLPSKQFILENSWYEHNNHLDVILEVACEHENPLTPNQERLDDVDQFTQIAESYFYWLAEQLSSNELIRPKACYAKLKELGL